MFQKIVYGIGMAADNSGHIVMMEQLEYTIINLLVCMVQELEQL